MFRSKVKIVFLAVALLVFASFLTLFSAFVYYIPEAPVSLAIFENIYDLFPFKKSFLEFYSPADRNYGVNKRTSIEINKFLLQRIEWTDDESEIAAIAHFYAIQAKERNYDIFITVPDRIKPQVMNHLIKELNENPDLSDQIMLLETTRTGKRIGKGAIWIENENRADYTESLTMEQRKRIFNEHLAETNVKQKYQDWWNLNLNWEEKKKINPLEDTGVNVSQCCG